jgi:hypothetical protein
MSKPPKEIDGAKVLFWAWSAPVSFGKVSDIEIYGLAICQYENSEDVYRFSCDENWETQQDGLYDSIEEAIEELPEQYKNVAAKWTAFE